MTKDGDRGGWGFVFVVWEILFCAFFYVVYKVRNGMVRSAGVCHCLDFVVRCGQRGSCMYVPMYVDTC